MEEKPLTIKTKQVLKLLNIGRSTLKNWIAIGRVHPLNLHKRAKMFAYSEIEQLAELPAKK